VFLALFTLSAAVIGFVSAVLSMSVLFWGWAGKIPCECLKRFARSSVFLAAFVALGFTVGFLVRDSAEIVATISDAFADECETNLTVEPGGRCIHPELGEFKVTKTGRAEFPYALSGFGDKVIKTDPVIGGVTFGFHAHRREPDNSWTILMAGSWEALGKCEEGMVVVPGKLCGWKGSEFRVYAVDQLWPSDYGTPLEKPAERPYEDGYGVLFRGWKNDDATAHLHDEEVSFPPESSGCKPQFVAVRKDESKWRIKTAKTEEEECLDSADNPAAVPEANTGDEEDSDEPPQVRAVESQENQDQDGPTVAVQSSGDSPVETPIGPCQVDDLIAAGSVCWYEGIGSFVVSSDGARFPVDGVPLSRDWLQVDWIKDGDHYTFQAVEVSSKDWRIYAAGQWQAVEGRDCQVGATIEPGYYCVWRGNPFRVYATNDLVTDREHAVQFTHGYAHLDLQFYYDAYDDQLISVTDDYEDKQGNPASRKFIAQRDPESDSRAWTIVCAD